MYTKIKQAVGRKLPTKRYADTDEAQTPDETIDPETWHHEATPGLGERIKRARRTLSIVGAIAAVALVLIWNWSGDFLMVVATHPWVITGAKWTVALGGAFMVGAKWQRGKLTNLDWLVSILPDGVEVYLGEQHTADDGTTVFIPFRGFDFLGFRSRQLQVGELGQDIAQTYAKNGRDMESPARIRVEDALAREQDTAYGRVIGVMSDGFEVDPWGQHSDVYTEPPDTVDQEMYAQLRDRLEQYVEVVVPRLESDIDALEQQVEDLRTRLGQSSDEAIDTFIDRYRQVEAVRENGTGSTDDDTPEITVGGDGELEATQ